MRLYLMRHADAVPRGTPGYARDAQRPLTEAGLRQAAQAAWGLKRLKVAPEAILTSPYVRARQTAEQVGRVLGPELPIREWLELRAEEAPARTSAALKQMTAAEELLLIGHEPHLSAWVAELIAGTAAQVQMKKAGVACVELDRLPPQAGAAVLRWLMTPKQLALIGRHDGDPAP